MSAAVDSLVRVNASDSWGPGSALHVVEHGTGTPLVALHGFPVDHRVMTGFLEPVFGGGADAEGVAADAAAVGGYRRIYPDLPGMGASPADGVASSDEVLARVEACIDERVGDAPFLLVGESYGGYLARAIANRRPEQVAGLALVCPIGIAVAGDERRVPRHEVRQADAGLIADLSPAEAAEFTELAVVESAETLARFRADVVPGAASADPEAVERIGARYELRAAPEHAAPPFTAPTLIVTGRQDAVVGYLDQWELLEHYPHASFAVLDAAGHNAQFERPALVTALLRDWLARVAAEAGR